MKAFKQDDMEVRIYESREDMGRAAADDVAEEIKRLLSAQSVVNVIFAAAPSQADFLLHLSRRDDVDFSCVNAFHMDEYIGLSKDAPQGFGNFLRHHIFDKVPFSTLYLLDGQADPVAESTAYAELLLKHPADIVCMGIGENAHIAFNDPGTARFDDPELVKIVELEPASRQQQVHDGCFQRLDDVPTHALTLTVPALMRAKRHFCIVPAATKARAVYDIVHKPVTPECPGTILRKTPGAVVYLDRDSAALLQQ